jgi:hypothetical protein
VTVVELDPEHAVPQRLDDLTGHLDLVFFLSDGCLLSLASKEMVAADESSPAAGVLRE